jgi:hypothetical protein
MNKDFIQYEQALDLEELGFNNENCFGFYNNAEAIPYIKQDLTDELKLIYTGDFEAPLYQQAFRFFREKYKMDSVIIRSFSMTNSYHYNIIIDKDYGNDLQSISIPNRTYEEAELECLKKLIEIAKTK